MQMEKGRAKYWRVACIGQKQNPNSPIPCVWQQSNPQGDTVSKTNEILNIEINWKTPRIQDYKISFKNLEILSCIDMKFLTTLVTDKYNKISQEINGTRHDIWSWQLNIIYNLLYSQHS